MNSIARLSLRRNGIMRASALVLAIATISASVSAQSDSAPPPPGKLIDLGGYRLHLNCTGSGSPAVVLSAGSGDFSTNLALAEMTIQNAIEIRRLHAMMDRECFQFDHQEYAAASNTACKAVDGATWFSLISSTPPTIAIGT